MKKCSTSNTEDCNCACYICEENQLKNSSALSKRKTHNLKIDWISCNSCNNWVHPQCSGINRKEFTKTEKIIKSNKTGNNFFKCLKCSSQSATALGVDLTKIIPAGKRKSVDTQTDF